MLPPAHGLIGRSVITVVNTVDIVILILQSTAAIVSTLLTVILQ